jgi:hypothetical protein
MIYGTPLRLIVSSRGTTPVTIWALVFRGYRRTSAIAISRQRSTI